MPNHCSNTVRFTHNDVEQINKIETAIEAGNLFATFAPVTYSTESDQMAVQSQTEVWGTKWDAYDGGVNDKCDDSIQIYFETAWCPPLGFYEAMVELGFGVNASYHEPGMQFCGYWIDGSDEYYEYNSELSVPQNVIDEFNLAEEFAEYEE